MAKIGDLSVNIDIEISEETVQRCCQLLQMYLNDNPNKTIKVDYVKDTAQLGEEVFVYIGEREATNVDKA